MKTIFSFFGIILFGLSAHPQSSAELTCRAQAKEVAVQTYSNCITEARNSQVEQIRSDYQKELAAVKNKYDKELKKLSGAAGKKSAKSKTPTAKEVRAASPKASKGVATQLPARNATVDATPIQNASEGTPVVTMMGSEVQSDSSLEKEAAEADQIEIVEMPVE